MSQILVVSDIDTVRSQVTSILQSPQCSVLELKSGRFVRDFVSDNEVDLVILDCQIGSMGAFAVTQDLRLEEFDNRLEHIPVLIMLDRRADTWLAREVNAEGFIIKPIDPIRLNNAVKSTINGKTWFDSTFAPLPLKPVHVSATSLPGLSSSLAG